MSSESFVTPAAQNLTEVFAVHGADPEVLAFAMAKYSRSSLSMRESIAEISAQRAEQFLNTFYFQYGHRSIADLAHAAFAVERLSLLAAIVLVDEQRWDGQERSTRYQNFLKSGWYFPDLGEDKASAKLYAETVQHLFNVYQRTTSAVFEAVRRRVPCPEGVKQDAYERTLKARAFDVARYLLPLATNTSLGQIVSARTLETQVSRLLSSPVAEVRELGIKLRDAATGPAWTLRPAAVQALAEQAAATPELAALAAEVLTSQTRTAPTLVKYAQPVPYQIETQKELAQAAAELLAPLSTNALPRAVVDLVEPKESLEVELAATLLYSASHHGYRAIRDLLLELPEQRISEIIELGLKHRGPHDEALRAFHVGAALRFDIAMDIGGFRDMHRHRRCTQIIQGFTTELGYETPTSGDFAADIDILAEAGMKDEFEAAIAQAHAASKKIAASTLAPEAASSALYLLPLATRCRALFKMDLAEAQYIIEMRSAPAGHFSYRRVAWEMFVALREQHPTLAKHLRVTDFTQPIDLLKR
jgi:thymidylate synthase ThyX